METLFDDRALAAWEDRQQRIFYIRLAAQRPRRPYADDNHPESIRERIEALQALLQEAGV